MANDDNEYDHDDDNGEQDDGDDELYDEDYTNENKNDDKFDYVKVKRKKNHLKNKKIQKGITDYINN